MYKLINYSRALFHFPKHLLVKTMGATFPKLGVLLLVIAVSIRRGIQSDPLKNVVDLTRKNFDGEFANKHKLVLFYEAR